MKKWLLALADLPLAGCTVHAQYKANFLQEYSGYDCRALSVERHLAELESERFQKRRTRWLDLSSRSAIVPASAANLEYSFVATPSGGPGYGKYHKARMRNHAQQQAILRLETSQGCRSKDADPNA